MTEALTCCSVSAAVRRSSLKSITVGRTRFLNESRPVLFHIY
jgi:hypothetical protein